MYSLALRYSKSQLINILIVAVIYFAAARSSLLLAVEHTNASPVWPPSGIALAAVLLLGRRIWPAIAVGAFSANVWILASFGFSLPLSLVGAFCTATGNTLEALVGGFLITRFEEERNPFQRTIDAIKFVAFGALVATVVSATIGVATLCTISGNWANYGFIWLTWWLGDAAGILVITPVILTWRGAGKGRWRLASIIEGVVLLSLLFVLWIIVFQQGNRVQYLFFPLLIWSALRFGQFESAFMVLLASAMIILSTVAGSGPFAGDSVIKSLMLVQGYLSVISATVMILAATLAERRGVQDELTAGNERLQREIIERRMMEISLRQSEEQFRGLLESAADGMVVVNDRHEILMVNAQFERMFGYGRTEILGKNIGILIPPRFDRHREYADEYIRRPKTRLMGHGGGLCALRKDGSEFPVEISLSPLKASGGMVVCGAVRDITERKRAEGEILRLNEDLERKVEERSRQLLEAQEELVRKEKLAMLGRIAGNMGNELLNPLGVMNNAVFFLGSALPGADETVREYLGIIASEIGNSRRIISDLLDFTRATPPRRKEVSLRELMDESIGRCAIPGNVAVAVELPETLPPVMADPPQMVQVFQNLIANAVQAMPNGGALHVAARRILNSELRIMNLNSKFNIQNSEFDGDFIEISVADTGEGISPENMEKLFQPLFTTRSRGIGLGLAISKNLTEANSGRIEVESRLGEGTTFSVLLPVEGGES